ncbi:MAG: family 10 glycosylhydrolase, partial [Clostridiales bacterium]|nr:family 10 glycosylhydrolase [Clostridiales bacterium]
MKKYISLVTTVIIISMISVIFFQLPSGAASPVNTAMTVDPEAGSSALQASEASLTLSRRASSPDADTELRGLWVATVLSLDYPSLPCTDSDALKNDALEILDYAADTGFNAIFLQVRPASDAIYKSAIYPWSKYLTGTQGQAPDNGFDPLQFWVTEAHKRGIELHAWINPYRITKKTSSEPAQSLSSLSPSNPAVKNPSWVVKYSDGNLYFNPGIPGVTKLIVDSVNELLNNYAIDGIHMDDYFYPGKDFNDSDTFKKYGTGYKSLEEWRLSNVDAMVSEVSKAVRSFGISPTATSAGTEQSSADRDLKFGISPFGIWANKSDNALGSATSGFQSYYSYYADSRKWVKEGLVDYIAPQIYWSMGFPTADYKTLVQWWKDVASGTGVKLYIGLAAYRSGDSEQSSPWYGITEIIRQLSFNEATTGVDGSIFFRYKAIKQIPALSPAIKTHFISHDEGAAVIPATIGRPLENIRTGYSSYYISGTSDPAKPLYLNGTRLEGRSASGYYGVLVKLNEGSNTFTVSQDASFASKVIYRTSSASSKMSKAEIVSSSVFPQTQEFRMPGETVTLACRAPSGAKLTVKINGKSLQMKQSSGASTSGSGSGIYSASFTCSYTMPSFTGTSRNVNLGAPVYTMKYGGKTKTLKAPAKIGVIMKSSPYYAMVNQETAIAYKSASTSNGSGYELSKGMSDYITGMTGGFVRLSSGIWLKASTVTAYTSKKQFKPAITAISYVGGSRWDELKLSVENSTAITTKAVAAVCTRADFDGSVLKLTLASVSTDKAAPVA